MNGLSDSQDLLWDTDAREDASSTTSLTETLPHDDHVKPDATLSLFESIITTYPPIFESLLSQIPTASLLDLYHTSKYLRDFLKEYPLAWRTLSFRLPQPAVVVGVGTPGNETPDNRERQSKAYSFDALLKQVIQPYGSRLTSLDVCNTAVTGLALSQVLQARIGTLQHLSVRGCKNVSIKYHIVPFLEPYIWKNPAWNPKDLALKSLYTYRCRHHRRRPYLPSSLLRRDSDSDPTHQLICICHDLGIWTDTAWCPTPGGRCFRRKDYHAGRAGPQNMAVWVPFDRLWRSSNRIGPMDGGGKKIGATDGRLWEISETGQDGEPLGPGDGHSRGEGKHVPTHLRKSHRIFIEDVKCAQCNDVITERCESCSVRMHCMGCRKTLCASCAFNRPIPRKRVKTRHFANLAFGPGASLGGHLGQATASTSSLDSQSQTTQSQQSTDQFWWAPGATRSPNLMNENVQDDDSSESEDGGNLHGPINPLLNRDPPKLNMHWCCLEPIFSGGGGIAVLGTGLGGRGADKIRAAPLPRTKDFEDPDFSNHLRPVDYVRELKNNGLYEYVLGEDVDILSYLKQDSLDLQAETCPRGLCQDCYRSFRWKVSCRHCKTSLCKEHDFRGLKFRKCGYRDMHTEREYARTHNETPQLVIPEFNTRKALQGDPEQTPTTLTTSQSTLEPSTTGPATPDGGPMSQSQVLANLMQSTAVDMSASTSQSSHLSNSDPFAQSALPYLPISSSRPRSFSASGVRSRNSGSWTHGLRGQVSTISNPLPLPCNPRHPVQWEGCGAYFCQSARPVGDHRTQCPAHLKECTECAVLVCDACTMNNPSCTCTFCTINYHCPYCARKKEVRAQCRFEEEQREKEAEQLRVKERMEKEKQDRGKADYVAGAAFEFWELMGLPNEGLVEQGERTDAVDLPAPSPDSITVTTEFGVHEEPNNFTVISAGLPSPSATSTEQESMEETTDAELEDGPSAQWGTAPSDLGAALLILSDVVTAFEEATGAGNAGDAEGDDASSEEDNDDDAESSVIDEFIEDEIIDDGALTPTTTTGHTS
ncbi:hypothetical protein BU24DRAFT_339361 [Aaosphaeria arxii CBS 175.79]|uniref:Uncharacterized protein n=1 Tax=Aaosphaeria arxii CBS 175.79 TaxID=1450172 RepID=A0A6A5Y7K6_9PLEO|nr:uncharacterized protein BU24DRAFT_339361 [Aaosphaeria arxii CBS 175.79]KAF2020790.1 hypothetical protein BU24DRAFT_339361 [Aaosphaeria arxii CBS 175.79]